MPEASLDKLDASTRVKLRSTQILTNLTQIVSELVQNSLDAGASLIDIGIDCEEWMFWVRDNGKGISKDGLAVLGKGSEEGRYGTSKSYAPDALNSLSTFGFRGEALASAAELSCLEICSRTAKSRETWSLIIKGGNSLYSGPAVRWRRESPGTVVCVRDAFHNLPVRRLSHSSPVRTLELIRQEVETYALIFPNVAFTLENLKSDRGISKAKILRIPKTSSILASFRNLYGRALTEHVEEVNISSGSLNLEGFISLNGAHSKTYQFLYVNRHPIARSDLHHIIDSRFSLSSFSKNALDEMGETSLPRSNVRRSPRKIEKRPVYVLNLTVPPDEVDNCLEPTKSNMYFQDRGSIAAFLSSSIQSFLIRHGFSIYHNAARNESSLSPRKRRKKDIDDSGYAEHMDPEDQMLDSGNPVESQGPMIHDVEGYERELLWPDSNTSERFIVNARTGNFHPRADSPSKYNAVTSDPFRQHRRTIVHASNKSQTEDREKTCPEWLVRALKANHVYDTAEPKIPVLKDLHSNADPPQHQHHCNPWTNQLGTSEIVDAEPNTISHRFSREELQNAEVVSQLDEKFIVCLIGEATALEEQGKASGRALVLIDQHAADERIRVEYFLKELCEGFLYNRRNLADDPGKGVRIRELSPPVPLLITTYEAERLKNSSGIREAFRHWGFRFVDSSTGSEQCRDEMPDNNSTYEQVSMMEIPEVIGDKLLSGHELRDLVKAFLGHLEAGTYGSETYSNSEDNTPEGSWLKALRWCPRELLDLINSKACRGAIMFNDALTISQCEKLVRDLSQTAFPFQCAHGRPSLVPLVNIGAVESQGKEKGRACNWSQLEAEKQYF